MLGFSGCGGRWRKAGCTGGDKATVDPEQPQATSLCQAQACVLVPDSSELADKGMKTPYAI